MNERALFDLYFDLRDKHGWLADCIDAGFDDDEIEYLENLDFEFMRYRPELEAEAWSKEVAKGGGFEIFFSENAEEKIALITKKISHLYSKADAAMTGNWSYVDVVLQEPELKRWEELRKRCRANQIFSSFPGRGSLTNAEIHRARNRSLKSILPDLGNRIPCPFHKGDGNNFSFKDNYGQCFVCGAWSDAIKWRMEIQGLSFGDAVRSLQ